MQRKKTFYTELAYVIGIAAIALGTALSERADLGMSMVVAPAYILHLKISETFPFFTFGMAEYSLQAVLLIVLCIVMHRPKRSYLFCFLTAVIYGFALDGFVALARSLPAGGIAYRILWYSVGLLFCATGVSAMFHTYLMPEAYELFVRELASKPGADISRTKTIYDLCSCAVSVALSFVFFGFGRFEGVKLGTIVCALVNGFLIGRISRILEARFEFRDAFPWRGFFSK